MDKKDKFKNMFLSMSREELIDFLKDCNIDIEITTPGKGGIYFKDRVYNTYSK